MRSLATAAAALVSADAASSCCAFGGSGSATLMGTGTYVFPTTPAEGRISNFVPIAVGASGNGAKNPFVGILMAPTTGPEDALAGWLIMPNKTTGGQTLVAWTNLPGEDQTCNRAFTDEGETFTPGYSLCFGAPNGLFPFPNGTYALQGVGPVTLYQQAADGRARASVSSNDCSPIFLAALNTPFNTGAFSVSFEEGTTDAPSWGLPTWC